MCVSRQVLPRIVSLVRKAVAMDSTHVIQPQPRNPGGSAGRGCGPPVFDADDVAAILAELKELDAAELGISGLSINGEDVSNRKNSANLPIGFCYVGGEPDLLEASIFVLPPNARIPGKMSTVFIGARNRSVMTRIPCVILLITDGTALPAGALLFLPSLTPLFHCSCSVHDHPSMHVFTRVLYGSMEVDEYELLEEANPGVYAAAKSTSLGVKGDVWSLSPEKGNVHSFRAIDWTAVFDVAIPPYDRNHPCQYFEPLFNDESVLLKKASCPLDYVTTEVEYVGYPLNL